ncbi:M-phase inducer phosphatase 1-B-like isoform X1 [Rhincodon typus]|uniref:M-phase inducer phosphatase 1-B-like isoform X1 n=1 Tax=Rhincodon typus TaxID=259920 RepID=UPI00202FA947|nr:M-phase inducer phosphatase 1-B-like isoform X1 [Rhincodon typus]
MEECKDISIALSPDFCPSFRLGSRKLLSVIQETSMSFSPAPTTSPDCIVNMSNLSSCDGETPKRCLNMSNLSNGSEASTSPEYVGRGLCLDSPGLTDVQLEFKQPTGRTQPLLPKVLCSSPMFSESGCWSPVQDRVDFQSLGHNKENMDFEMAGTSSPMLTESLGLDDSANVGGVCEVFSELSQCDTEGNKNMTLSSSLAALLTSDILIRTMGMNAVPACKSRPGLFRSPSMPERLHRPFLKRPERAREMDCPVKTKRQKSLDSPLEDEDQERSGNRPLRRAMTTCNVDVTKVLDEERNATELIGNFSKVYALPTVMGKHGDLKYISPEMMAKVLHGEYDHLLEGFYIVDCRYPYEFKGGHIRGALNLHKADDCIDYFFQKPVVPKSDDKRLIVIFHCEFSSERGPKMCRLLREEDRNLNEYPNLYYPELYILKGGYKAFFPQFMNYCDPPTYCPMDHEDFQEEMLKLRKKSKSWAGERRRRDLISRLRKM